MEDGDPMEDEDPTDDGDPTIYRIPERNETIPKREEKISK